MLTERELKIATKLLESRVPITTKELSEDFNISTRTIKNDLSQVRDWFKAHQMEVDSQPGKGIWVNGDEETRSQALNEILGNERQNQIPDPNFRLRKILLMLLLKDEYLTAAEFADSLLVSRNTILNDMNLVDEFVAPWQIKLERARRRGYRLVGEELHLRLLLEHLIYSGLTNYDIYQMMTMITNHEQVDRQEFLIEHSLLPFYTVAVKHLRQLYRPEVSDLFHQSDLIALLIRVTVSIKRLILGEALKGYRVLNKKHYTDNISLFVLSFMEGVFSELELPLLENEFLYISGEIKTEKKGIDLIQVTNGIISYVGELEGIEYRRDPRLFSNLFAHLSLRLQRGMFNMVEDNPFADEIKHHYPELFEHVSKACEKFLGATVMANQEYFVSFITLHFLASFENTFTKWAKVRALYVCSTGRGVARLIKSRVEKEIREIDLVGHCSMMKVEELCKKEKVDLIISVFPIKAEIPVIVVDAIPSKHDIEKIRETVDRLMKKHPRFQSNSLFEEQNPLDEDSEDISQEIILKGFEVQQEILSEFREDIMETRLQALQLHIFLMVHRYYFDKQYDDFMFNGHSISEKNKQHLREIKKILDEKELPVHESELIALLQYFK